MKILTCWRPHSRPAHWRTHRFDNLCSAASVPRLTTLLQRFAPKESTRNRGDLRLVSRPAAAAAEEAGDRNRWIVTSEQMETEDDPSPEPTAGINLLLCCSCSFRIRSSTQNNNRNLFSITCVHCVYTTVHVLKDGCVRERLSDIDVSLPQFAPTSTIFLKHAIKPLNHLLNSSKN